MEEAIAPLGSRSIGRSIIPGIAMVYSQQKLIKFAALLLMTTVAVPMGSAAIGRGSTWAQLFGETPESFPIPSALPAGTTLRVDGSHSMTVTNQTLESRFEERFPDVDVELDASRTDEAIADLLNGDIELVAAGRPLTEAEKAQGLAEIPLEREKLAIVLGADNPFNGNLSFEQFARIFRGEITNWAEVGGPDRPIRLVDRPDFSDTRRALSTYEVFREQPFATGDTAEVVDTDDTADMVAALGEDGIGYAVYSQVSGVDGIQILPMHETLPDDPRYPYSQYRAYVYQEAAPPAVLAFLGFATTAPGQEVFEDAATADGADPANVDADAVAGADAAATDADNVDAATGDGATSDPEATVGADAEAETALVPEGAATDETRGGFPWWLLGIPILGGLLWWLLRGLRGGAGAAVAPTPAAPAAAPIAAPVPPPVAEPRLVLTPRNCRDAYAYWEVPRDRHEAAQRQGGEALKVRLYDVTDRAADAALPPPVAEFACSQDEPDLHLPIERDDRDYRAVVGYVTDDNRWLPLAQSAPVRVPACPQPTPQRRDLPGAAVGAAAVGAAGLAAAGATALGRTKPAPSQSTSRLVLTPRHSHDAYAYWEVPESHFADLRKQGGQRKLVRLYDVTNRTPDAPLPPATSQFACNGAEPDLHLPIKQCDRDYVAEVGYLTGDSRWLPAARSQPVRVPGNLPGGQAAAPFPARAVAGTAAAVGAAAAGVGAIGAGQRLKDTVMPGQATSRIVLTPRHAKKAYAYWEVPAQAHAAMQSEGGRDPQLRIYDVTDIDIDKQPPHSVLTYDVATKDCDRFVPLPDANRDYIAEVGYRTDDGSWLELARSQPVRPSAVLAPSPGLSGVAAGVGAAAGVATVAAIASPRKPAVRPTPEVPARDRCAIQTVKVHSRDNAVPLATEQMHHLQTAVSAQHALDQGLYVLRLREGVFNYDGDEHHPGEPFVLLWIYGGQVVNQKTGVPVQATWSTLNGYADTLTLEVREPAQLCAFFMDTFPDDNRGEVTLSVIKL